MNLYIVDYWMPIPASAHGGVHIVTAQSDEQCIDIITKQTRPWEREGFEGEDPNQEHFTALIANCVREAIKFPVADTEARMVRKFIT